MSIEKVAVIGSGLMGHGIAQVAAMSGQTVALIDKSEDALAFARQKMGDSLKRLAEKGRIKDTPEAVLGRIRTTSSLADGVRDDGRDGAGDDTGDGTGIARATFSRCSWSGANGVPCVRCIQCRGPCPRRSRSGG